MEFFWMMSHGGVLWSCHLWGQPGPQELVPWKVPRPSFGVPLRRVPRVGPPGGLHEGVL